MTEHHINMPLLLEAASSIMHETYCYLADQDIVGTKAAAAESKALTFNLEYCVHQSFY
jgi:hypothetical protein